MDVSVEAGWRPMRRAASLRRAAVHVAQPAVQPRYAAGRAAGKGLVRTSAPRVGPTEERHAAVSPGPASLAEWEAMTAQFDPVATASALSVGIAPDAGRFQEAQEALQRLLAGCSRALAQAAGRRSRRPPAGHGHQRRVPTGLCPAEP